MTEPDPEILAIAREEATDRLQRIESGLLALEQGTAPPGCLDAIFREAHSIKGAAGMVGWDDVATMAHSLEDVLDAARTGGEFHAELAGPLLETTDALRGLVAGETASAPAPDPVPNPDPAPLTVAAPTPDPTTAPDQALAPARARASLRVSADKVDWLLEGVGETLLRHRQLEHALTNQAPGSEDELEEAVDAENRLLDELKDSVLGLRTLPLISVTASYPRAVRNLAATEGKEVDLEISGAETQLDRAILEEVSDTIVHLLRNSVAHGIEPPAERERSGKPRRGRIELRAAPRGHMVAIEIADDGRGIDPTLLAQASDSRPLIDILAAAGISTADAVTDLAGRGVGLDAVKNDVEKLSGTLDIESQPGAGTTVTLLVPLTLALLDVLLLDRGGQVFGLPMSSVHEVIGVTTTTSLEGRRAVELRGESLPLRDLATMIGATAGELPESHTAVLIRSVGGRMAVGCDGVLGDEQVVTKSLGPLLAAVPGYLGAAVLGDGRVALILDPGFLLHAPARAGPALATHEPESPAERTHKVLVVDDQFTVRELQRSILQTAGYEVETCGGGGEALERIATDDGIDLVLTDLDMPGMDGLELLRTLRAGEPAQRSLPVVMVTANGSEDDKTRGVEAGADAYIVKDEFDQQSLLETVARLVGG